MDNGLLGQVRKCSFDYMARIQHDKEFDVFDVEPLCLLIGSLNVSGNLDPEFLGFIIEKLITSLDLGSKALTI